MFPKFFNCNYFSGNYGGVQIIYASSKIRVKLAASGKVVMFSWYFYISNAAVSLQFIERDSMFLLAFMYDSGKTRSKRQLGVFFLVSFQLERGSSFVIYREGLIRRKWLVKLNSARSEQSCNLRISRLSENFSRLAAG